MNELKELGRIVKCMVSVKYHMAVTDLSDLMAKLPFTNTKLWEVRSVYHLVRVCQNCYVIALILDDEEMRTEAGDYLTKLMIVWLNMMV